MPVCFSRRLSVFSTLSAIRPGCWRQQGYGLCRWRFFSGVLVGALLALLLSGCDMTATGSANAGSTSPRQLGQTLLAVKAGIDGGLQSSKGPVPLGDLQDKVLLVSFGYTNCPDICPANLAVNGQALNQLDATQRTRVRVLMVSVDPARDTPEHLQRYLAFFHPEIMGLRLDAAALAPLAKAFGAIYVRQGKPGDSQYSIDHTARTFVLNRQGELVQTLDFGASQEEVLAALRPLL